jgi:hypothetical protein
MLNIVLFLLCTSISMNEGERMHGVRTLEEFFEGVKVSSTKISGDRHHIAMHSYVHRSCLFHTGSIVEQRQSLSV